MEYKKTLYINVNDADNSDGEAYSGLVICDIVLNVGATKTTGSIKFSLNNGNIKPSCSVHIYKGSESYENLLFSDVCYIPEFPSCDVNINESIYGDILVKVGCSQLDSSETYAVASGSTSANFTVNKALNIYIKTNEGWIQGNSLYVKNSNNNWQQANSIQQVK